MRISILIFLAFALISCSKKDESPDILKIYEHFTLSSAAASKCASPEKDELTKFLANYQMVSIYAMQEIQKRKPEYTKDDAVKKLSEAQNILTKQVESAIEKEGCNSKSIQDLIKRFHALSQWKP